MLVECQACEAIIDAETVASYDDYEEATETKGRYSFLKCPKCSRPFIALQINDGSGWSEPQTLYPPLEMGIDLAIPSPIRTAFEEARSCYKAKAFTATAIMCRKALEGICNEHGVSGPNLATSLKELKDKGIIESRLYEWADALRISGNEAAHDVSVTISAQDARDIVEFTHALLEYVFTFRERFEQFKKRRTKIQHAA